jgi:hypothetical protein
MVVVLVLQNGCATVAPPAPSQTVRENLGVVAIVPAQYTPDSNFVTFAKGADAGAAKGAAIAGGATAIGSGIVVAAAAPIVVPVGVFVGVLMTAAAIVGGAIGGAEQAVPIETANQVEAAINHAVAGLDAQNVLANRLAKIVETEPRIRLAVASAPGPGDSAARPTYAQLRTAGIDTVLEVAVTEIGFESCGPEFIRSRAGGCTEDPQKRLVDLFMSVQARLVRVSDGTELFLRQFRYASPRREIPRWIAQEGQLLAEEFEHAYRELAARVQDEVLLVTPLDLPAPSSSLKVPGVDSQYGICWLAPIYPQARPITVPEMLDIMFSKPADFCPASAQLFTVIDTLRPTLRWSEFPRDLDRQQLDPALMQKISNVTYDLKIWAVEGCERGWLIYERAGLAAPEHPIEEALAPASRYFWSVRARFALDDRPMATRWSHFDVMTCFPNDIADWQYHRFITPP